MSLHCVKSVCIRSYSGQHFAAFGQNAERYYVPLRTQSECGKMRTRITQNTDTFYAQLVLLSGREGAQLSFRLNSKTNLSESDTTNKQ